MDPQALERLMIDRALGALSPDTESLLGAYLAADPAAARRDAEYRRTAELAKAALRQQSVAGAVPPLWAPRIQRQQAVRRWKGAAIRVAAMAACLAVGIFAGKGFAPGSGAPPVAPPSPVCNTIVLSASPSLRAAEADESGFWSIRRLVKASPAGAAIPGLKLERSFETFKLGEGT